MAADPQSAHQQNYPPSTSSMIQEVIMLDTRIVALQEKCKTAPLEDRVEMAEQLGALKEKRRRMLESAGTAEQTANKTPSSKDSPQTSENQLVPAPRNDDNASPSQNACLADKSYLELVEQSYQMWQQGDAISIAGIMEKKRYCKSDTADTASFGHEAHHDPVGAAPLSEQSGSSSSVLSDDEAALVSVDHRLSSAEMLVEKLPPGSKKQSNLYMEIGALRERKQSMIAHAKGKHPTSEEVVVSELDEQLDALETELEGLPVNTRRRSALLQEIGALTERRRIMQALAQAASGSAALNELDRRLASLTEECKKHAPGSEGREQINEQIGMLQERRRALELGNHATAKISGTMQPSGSVPAGRKQKKSVSPRVSPRVTLLGQFESTSAQRFSSDTIQEEDEDLEDWDDLQPGLSSAIAGNFEFSSSPLKTSSKVRSSVVRAVAPRASILKNPKFSIASHAGSMESRTSTMTAISEQWDPIEGGSEEEEEESSGEESHASQPSERGSLIATRH
eukprot:gnl/MRDRNA2_/MRDRNA2_66536_c0_seq4.p1 gnl/MRDRNA2_/MRDRNA2_66536_c0~~gnl/MRDRNA2_/MRDRNA2_66536_c0_seq4.p1  ORF type:complete len:561 (+),score=117.18 gnl/MRDRNA2_/MRDRNA2_66536_c0_seq4:152-1684(+)